ncbi:MAG: aldo/keto reductase [Spirochaetales bacterium]|nr:aldo/keto reductase [Spirochaetales bacterium]
MKKSKLGNSDLYFSNVGLGTWAIGGPDWAYGWGPQDDESSIRAINHALDLGINWIDTAAVYGLGHSEELLGRALKGRSEKPYVATKCGRHWSSEGQRIFGNLTRKAVLQEVEDSLRRLSVDCIDLYQIHWPDPEAEIEEAWEAIHQCVAQGKIRYAGVSNFTPEQMKHIQAIGPITSLQPPYSMIKPGIESFVLPFCAENDIAVICYSPMYKGLLSEKFDKHWAESLPASDHRSADSHFQEPELSVNLWFTGELKKLIADTEYTLAHLAIAWTLRRPEVTCAIVGARSPKQIEETARAGEWQLDDELIRSIDKLMARRKEKIKAL